MDDLKSAEEMLFDIDDKYHEKKGRKWVLMLILMVVFGIGGYFLMPLLYRLMKSSYDRKGIESICDELFGNVNIKDMLTEEVMVVAYEYNKHQPRLYTKYAARLDPETYNVSITDASEASSSAPIYFDPKVLGDEVLIDGGVIANSPALYAYLHSAYLLNKTQIRVVSIGTGMT